MSFDARSLERLQQLGRTLPQPLPKPAAAAAPPPATAKRHRVETETDPQALFRELMQVSPDGTVPPHLMDRLRQAEADAERAAAASAAAQRRAQLQPPGGAAPSGDQRRGTTRSRTPLRPGGQRRGPLSAEELELYGAFQDLLHLESDEREESDGAVAPRRPPADDRLRSRPAERPRRPDD